MWSREVPPNHSWDLSFLGQGFGVNPLMPNFLSGPPPGLLLLRHPGRRETSSRGPIAARRGVRPDCDIDTFQHRLCGDRAFQWAQVSLRSAGMTGVALAPI